MDAAPTDLGSHGNGGNEGNGVDERQPSEEARGSCGRDKGKGKMTEAQEAQEAAEEEVQKEREHKALEQRREEMMGWVAADLAAENKKIRDTQTAAASLAQTLSEMQELDATHPRFAQAGGRVPPVADRFGSGQRPGQAGVRGPE
jgi:hypothetical protein